MASKKEKRPAVLDARGKTYEQHATYAENAEAMQELKDTLRKQPGWEHLPASTKEALDMVMHKTIRMVNGQQDLPDNFDDIIGYTTLAKENA